jgi:hypothetical protein
LSRGVGAGESHVDKLERHGNSPCQEDRTDHGACLVDPVIAIFDRPHGISPLVGSNGMEGRWVAGDAGVTDFTTGEK